MIGEGRGERVFILFIFFLNVGFHVLSERRLVAVAPWAERALQRFYLQMCVHVPFEILLESESSEATNTLERIWVSVDVNVR